MEQDESVLLTSYITISSSNQLRVEESVSLKIQVDVVQMSTGRGWNSQVDKGYIEIFTFIPSSCMRLPKNLRMISSVRQSSFENDHCSNRSMPMFQAKLSSISIEMMNDDTTINLAMSNLYMYLF